MSAISTDIRDTITFVVQKTFSITIGVLGALRITDNSPSETSLAVAKVVIGGLMLSVAAIVEVVMWRSRIEARRRVSATTGGSDDQLAERMQLLERALIDRLPPAID